MSEFDWQACGDPALLLENMERTITRAQLVEFVRRCWIRVTPYLPVQNEITVVEEFAALVGKQSEHDAALYAYEAALKAARWAPDMNAEQQQQAALLREILSDSW
ncbi:MAG TPA: hypothetical protein VFE62_22580 [Gemmataceae bacterium]|nr:hypothetical protein [Gemmataceae bacterium]